MSVVFENDDNEYENDYIKIMTNSNDEECLVITRKNNKLTVESNANKKISKEERSK